MRGLPHLDRDRFSRLQQELAGEDILWAGQPDPGVSFWRAMFIWLFALPWTAFAFGWEAMALSAFLAEQERETGAAATVMAYVFPLFGLPFVGVGLWMLALPFVARWRAQRMVHVLTARRLVTATFTREALKVTSLDPVSILGMKRVEKPDGSGNLTLRLGAAPVLIPASMGHGAPVMTEAEREETLWGVPEVAALEAALLKLKG